MLINKDEVKRLMKEHKLVTQDDLNALFRNMIHNKGCYRDYIRGRTY